MNTYVLVHTIMYLNLNVEPCISGFHGALCDANMLVPEVQQPYADQGSEEGDYCDPFPEDVDFFNRDLMLRSWKRQSASLWMT